MYPMCPHTRHEKCIQFLSQGPSPIILSQSSVSRDSRILVRNVPMPLVANESRDVAFMTLPVL